MAVHHAPSDLDYDASLGADQDARIALEEDKARADAFAGDTGALRHLLIAEVQRQTARERTEADVVAWFAYVLREPIDTVDPSVQVIRTFADLWGVGPAVAVLGEAMASVNGDSFNEVRR